MSRSCRQLPLTLLELNKEMEEAISYWIHAQHSEIVAYAMSRSLQATIYNQDTQNILRWWHTPGPAHRRQPSAPPTETSKHTEMVAYAMSRSPQTTIYKWDNQANGLPHHYLHKTNKEIVAPPCPTRVGNYLNTT